jgi:ribosomal protein S18 acetylase RimI-like enzyme
LTGCADIFRNEGFEQPFVFIFPGNMIHTILIATPSDSEDIAKLVNSAYRGESSRKGWTTEADLLDGTRTNASAVNDIIEREDGAILKCLSGNTIVGCVELNKSGREMYLGMLTVQPELQGSGIGKKLLFAAEDEARKQKFNKITMTVISVRSELIDWYKRHGYVDTGKRKPFPFSNSQFGIPKQVLKFIVLEKNF